MLNEKVSEGQSRDLTPKPSHYWFVDGLVNSLCPRLEEIEHPEELVESESTMELIRYSFGEIRIVLEDLGQDQLWTIAKVMPLILEDLQRLNYPLLQPELFDCVKSFVSKLEQAAEGHGSKFREEIDKILKG
jgi:hypothetical protein